MFGMSGHVTVPDYYAFRYENTINLPRRKITQLLQLIYSIFQ